MNKLTRRTVLKTLGAAPLLGAGVARAASAPSSSDVANIQSITTNAKPITAAERHARVAKLQGLMAEQKIGAMLVEPGSSLDYFTGVRWQRSERITAAIIPAHGEVIIVTPAFEEPSIRETLQVGNDVRPWNEHESPYERLAQGLRDRGVASGTVAVEPTLRFFITDGIRQTGAAYQFVSGAALVRACRLIKSPAELSLMQTANDVTIAAIRYVHQHLERGMTSTQISSIISEVTNKLGGTGDFALVLLNEASAYPHGSNKPQEVHEGSIVLLDCGCEVHGYESDISRTWVSGEANAHQRKLWDTVKRGQLLALETAKIGVPVGQLDDVVRKFYESEGWGPGYKLPGLPHRTGHGIGMDGHEPAYLVHGDSTPLQAGMCFSDEPGLYIPGEFGVRLEDCWHMTASGPVTFTPLAKSIDDPV